MLSSEFFFNLLTEKKTGFFAGADDRIGLDCKAPADAAGLDVANAVNDFPADVPALLPLRQLLFSHLTHRR